MGYVYLLGLSPGDSAYMYPQKYTLYMENNRNGPMIITLSPPYLEL